MHYVYIVCLALFLGCTPLQAQENYQYNLNLYNGLLSNNVYHTMVDRVGYLWIATDKGVMRYNGYELKAADLTSGFINKDIWSLCEDKKGRIWLSSISELLGYLKNEKYHSAYTTVKGKYYQKLPRVYKDGVYFTSTVLGDKFRENGGFFFCVERNDTIQSYDISRFGNATWPVSEKTLISLGRDGCIYQLECAVDGTLESKLVSRVTEWSPHSRGYENGRNIVDFVSGNASLYAKGNIYYAAYGDSYIRWINARQGRQQEKWIGTISGKGKDEPIRLIFERDEAIIVFTAKNIYKLDSDLNLVKTYHIDSLVHRKKDEPLSYFIEHPLWGTIVSTYDNGIYAIARDSLRFRKEPRIDFTNFYYCGSISDSIGFWWNETTRQLVELDAKMNIRKRALPVSGHIKVLPYLPGKRLLMTSSTSCLLDAAKGTTTPFIPRDVFDAVVADTNEFYLLSKFTGFYHRDRQNAEIVIDKERYEGIIYDSVRQQYCIYNHHKILFYKEGQPPRIFGREELEAKGINSVRSVLVDNKYGNIFVCEENRVLLFTDFERPYLVLFDTYVFKESIAAIRGNLLFIAGTFGLLFSEISGVGNISAPVVFPNTKKVLYNFVSDMQVSTSRVILNTDMGVYSAAIPSLRRPVSVQNGKPGSYVFVATYADSTFMLAPADTLNIHQAKPQLLFDVIRPTGTSTLRFSYALNGKNARWRNLANNELLLPELGAGRYHTLLVKAYDDQWCSDVHTVTLYVLPYWWQRPFVQRIIWAASIVLFLLLIYLVVVITRRNVIRKAARRSQLLEIELKSIYAQLNPHFIFNSLSGALFLVKTKRLEDAYEHIYKFSHLVRSYIKSSRDRYILLKDEIVNLQNYIELQQVRFKGRFDYKIDIGEGVNTEVKIPALLLQPVVENAIDHGLLYKEQKGKLTLRFAAQVADNELWCIIDDDGIGRIKAAQMQKDNPLKTESYGNSLIKDLSEIFNKYERIKIDISYLDKIDPDTGTTVTIKIKFPRP